MKLFFDEFLTAIRHLIWETPAENLPRYFRPFLATVRIGHLILRDLFEGQLTLRSMGLVYTTLLALVPLLALSFSVLKGFGVHNQLEPIMLNLFSALGEKGIEITQRILSFVDNIKAGVLGSLGLAMLIYTVISLLQKIERAFNFIWRVSEQRPWAQRFSDYLSVILIGPVLVFSALGITASVSSSTIVKSVIQIQAIGTVVTFLSHLVPYILIILAFTFIYIFVPNTKVKFKSALIGGLVGGILWETTGWGFAAFVVGSSKYTAIYSAFATLIIFMIWLYLSWLTLLIGGSIAFYHQHPERRTLDVTIQRLSSRMRERVALTIMGLVGQHFYHDQPAWSAEALATRMGLRLEVSNQILADLVEAQLLVPTMALPTTYLPAHALETMNLKTLIKTIRQMGETTSLQPQSLPAVAGVSSLLNDMDSAIYTAMGDRSLRDLVMKTESDQQ